MKLPKNKKYYNFTENQKRNDSHRIYGCHFHTVGKSFKIQANKKFRRVNKSILFQIVMGGNDLPFERYRKYMWWDI